LNNLMRHPRLGLLSPFLVASLAIAEPASASAPVVLDWSAPDGCPSGDDVLEEVTRLLGARPETNESVLRVTALVKRKDGGPFVVRLEIPSPEGPRFREVSAVSCAALAQATALILALMIDPDAALAEPPPSGPPNDSPGQTQIPPNPAPPKAPQLAPFIPVPLGRLPPAPQIVNTAPIPKAAPNPSPYRRPGVALAAYFAGDLGSLPTPAPGAGGNLSLLFENWRLQLGGAYFAEQQDPFAALPTAGSKVHFFAFHSGIGTSVSLHTKVEFIPHFHLEIGRFSASSFGVSQPGQGAAIAVGANGGGVVAIKIIEQFRLVMGADFVLYLVHPQFLVTGLGVVHEPSAFVGRLALGGEVRF
jgi:hypothetical protein